MASRDFFRKSVLILLCTIAHSSGLPIDNGHESSSDQEPIRGADPVAELLQKTVTNTSVASPYIVIGSNATSGQFPYHVSVQYGTSASSFHICGGSILSRNWVVTAAHCVSNFVSTPTILRVVAGRVQLYNPDNIGQTVVVQKVVIHPNFTKIANPYSITGDIALLKLLVNLVLNTPTVRSIALPYQNEIPDFIYNALHTSIGWGTLPNGNISNNLLFGYTKAITKDWCQNQLGYALQNEQLCSDGYSAVKPCSGDEGGSLVPLYGTQKLVGIYSWRPAGECNSSQKPGVYTQVSAYSNWLLTTMATN